MNKAHHLNRAIGGYDQLPSEIPSYFAGGNSYSLLNIWFVLKQPNVLTCLRSDDAPLAEGIHGQCYGV